MDGYLYMLIIFLLVFKCSVYFCWYKARRERYLSAQQQAAICTIQNAQGNTVYVQNAQAHMLPPSAYRNQGLVERPVAPHYQHTTPTNDKPPAYNDIAADANKATDGQPPPPTYYYATTYPAAPGGPTSPAATVPYPNQPTSGPTSPNAAPYTGNVTYPPYLASGPVAPGSTPYPATAGASMTTPASVPLPYPAGSVGSTTAPGTTPYPYQANAGAPMTNPGTMASQPPTGATQSQM